MPLRSRRRPTLLVFVGSLIVMCLGCARSATEVEVRVDGQLVEEIKQQQQELQAQQQQQQMRGPEGEHVAAGVASPWSTSLPTSLVTTTDDSIVTTTPADAAKESYMDALIHRIRQTTLSQAIRNSVYTDQIMKLIPTCIVITFLEDILSKETVCRLVAEVNDYMASSPPQVHKFFKHALQPTQQMNRELPQPLTKFPGNLPEIIPEHIADSERHTFYWYYAMVAKAWDRMRDLLLQNHAGDKYPGWWFADGWETGALMQAPTGPFAVTICREGHLVVVMRGSAIHEDWAANFNYTLRTVEETSALGVPGRAHTGFLQYLQMLAPQIDEEMERVRPWKVTLTGDSLGGAMANMAALYVATKYGHTLSEKVEVVAIGAPVIGDKEMAIAYQSMINGRSPAFLGQGFKYGGRLRSPVAFELGDLVVQVPWDCLALPECNFASKEMYRYQHPGGLIKILPTMMPNTVSWIKEANWAFDMNSAGMSTTHMCSYWCWATNGLPPPYTGNNCYFWRDKHSGPATDICLMSMSSDTGD